jgi:hypothetical protein
MDHCIDIELDPKPMCRGKQKRASKAWARGIAQHHDGTTTDIYFLKAQLTGNFSWDVENYSTTHPDFPYTSTGDQLYGEWDFEAYRALGYELAEHALADRVFAGLLRKPSATTPPPEVPSTDSESAEPTDLGPRWTHRCDVFATRPPNVSISAISECATGAALTRSTMSRCCRASAMKRRIQGAMMRAVGGV